jgi:hypothetical protein
MTIKRINVFTGQEHTYDRIGSAEKDGFSKKSIMSCLCGSKNTHKGFFWCKADETITYEELKNNLEHLSLQRAKSYYTFAMQLDGVLNAELVCENKLEPKIHLSAASRKYKPIERINMITGIVTEYLSIADAVRDGFDRSTIQRALKGVIDSYRGFYWQFI